MQTFNGVSKTKKTQTDRVNMVDAGRVGMHPLPLGHLDLEGSVDTFFRQFKLSSNHVCDGRSGLYTHRKVENSLFFGMWE